MTLPPSDSEASASSPAVASLSSGVATGGSGQSGQSIPPPQSLRSDSGSRFPPALAPLPEAAADAVGWLRAEVAASTAKTRQARLLGEIGEIEERHGDEPGAARDYLAAFNADPTFREPLEGLVRLLERRRSFKNLGKVIDAFVKASKKPAEAGRSLLMKSAFAADVMGDLNAARDLAMMATKAAATGPESALAWLTLEVLAGKLGDAPLRREALTRRAAHTTHPTWRALLLLDLAELAEGEGDLDGALALCRDAQDLEGGATFRATVLAARFLRRERSSVTASGDPDTMAARRRAYAAVLESQAKLLGEALDHEERGDALGVPRWARHRSHVADAWQRGAAALVEAGDLEGAARVLDAAQAALGERREGEAALFAALELSRMRVADRLGDTGLAAELATRRLEAEADPRIASTFALRIAEHALQSGDTGAAERALARALLADPAETATRALQLDLVEATAGGTRLADELLALAEQLPSPAAKARTLLTAALLVGAEGGDVPRARALLERADATAPNAGVPASPEAAGIAARVGRIIAAVREDALLREQATRALIGGGAEESEWVDLWFEVIRATFARGAESEAEVALQTLAEAPGGAWLAGALQAFLPGRADGQTEALDSLSQLEPVAERRAALTLVAALRAQQEGDLEGAKRRLRKLLGETPGAVLVAVLLADLERDGGARAAAADTLAQVAEASSDPELSAALFLEAGLDRWRGGDRPGAVQSFERASHSAPLAAQPLLRWASRGVGFDTLEGRRSAIERATEAGEDAPTLALERFATELLGGDPAAAVRALTALELEDGTAPALHVAGDLGRLVSGPQHSSPSETEAALTRLSALGEVPATAAAAERLRALRADGGPASEETELAARRWLDSGGGLAAALEWLASTFGRPEESAARRALALFFDGEAREALLTSAVLLQARAFPGALTEPIEGTSDAVRLANLELAPPAPADSQDLARRARALADADGPLGAGGDAVGLSGWALLANGDGALALAAFRHLTGLKPGDLGAWAGVHAAARALGDKGAQAEAAAALGARCGDAARGAKFWEEAGLLLLDLGRGPEAETALDAAFERDPSRSVAFDRLFRRVRERKDGDKLLDLISKRLDFSDDPAEIVKLYWERSRVLREKGDLDGAVVALENVTMVEPDHVGALALSGEIFIRRGQFAEAAEALGRLAKIEDAPPKNRATAGIAAVDIFENKLDRTDLALEILVVLHKANLTNLPVRERLARAAAKTGSWQEAASILEELMLERATPAGRIEAAQLAMAIRRDRLSDRAGATKAMVKLLEESPGQGDAVDLLLDAPLDADVRKRLLTAAREGLLAEVAAEPARGAPVRRLAHVAHALGDQGLEQSALAAAAVLGTLDDAGRGALLRISQTKPKFPRIALTEALSRNVVAAGDDGPIAELFALLGPTLAEGLGPTLAVMGLAKKDRVDPRAGSPVRQEVAAWAGSLGLPEFELYVGGRDPLGVQGIPGEPHCLVVGADVRAPFPLATRARVARELFAIGRGTTILRLRDETTILAIVVAACKLAEVPLAAPGYAVQAEVDRLLSKAISRKTKKSLTDVCQRIVQTRADARTWSQRAIATLDRVAVIATGDVGVVLGDIIGQAPERLADVVHGDRRSEDLLRFVLSPGYLDVRRTLGLEGST